MRSRSCCAEVVKLLSNFYRRNETDRRLSVGIITPYRGQVELITDMIYGNRSTVEARKLQNKVRRLVKTVDGFQGNEQDIIVISPSTGLKRSTRC